MNREQLVRVLGDLAPAGRVTAYAGVSMRGCGVPNHNRPVRSLPRGAANHGHQRLTNRVVDVDGGLADSPEGANQQRRQQGVPFTADGRVDFARISPVALA